MQFSLPFGASANPATAPVSAPAPPLGPRARGEPPPAPRVDRLVFVRHQRARRYILRVLDDGSVRVTMPRWGSKREAAAFAEREQAWITKQRRDQRHAPATGPACDVEQRVLRARADRELPPRLRDLAAAQGLTIRRISIRNQRWRWGSCSRRGDICLNWRLILLPSWVRDYVMIHELMHLRRMDHSPVFWRLVAEACPDYLRARAVLREWRV